MSTAESTLEASSNLESPMWTQELGSHPDRMRMRARVAGMHCSLCTGTIEKALRQHPGVDAVAVSLTHEQALVEYDPAKVRPQVLLETSAPDGLQHFGSTQAKAL
ncbi:heavy-metal-associated domain-containing protein [Massilia phosphatilytica]